MIRVSFISRSSCRPHAAVSGPQPPLRLVAVRSIGASNRSGRGRGSMRLGLIAHDAKKRDLLDLARRHSATLRSLRLVATGTTGRRLTDETGLQVETMVSGPEGGDLQIGARIADGRLGGLIFLRDPLTAHPHEPDIQALLKACDVHEIPVATNLASAEILLEHLASRLEGAA